MLNSPEQERPSEIAQHISETEERINALDFSTCRERLISLCGEAQRWIQAGQEKVGLIDLVFETTLLAYRLGFDRWPLNYDFREADGAAFDFLVITNARSGKDLILPLAGQIKTHKELKRTLPVRLAAATNSDTRAHAAALLDRWQAVARERQSGTPRSAVLNDGDRINLEIAYMSDMIRATAVTHPPFSCPASHERAMSKAMFADAARMLPGEVTRYRKPLTLDNANQERKKRDGRRKKRIMPSVNRPPIGSQLPAAPFRSHRDPSRRPPSFNNL